MIRLLAIADLHVSDTAAVAGMRPTDRRTGRPMALEQAARSLAWVADQCATLRPDALIIAGDVYSSPRPTPAAEAVVVDALARIADGGVPVMVLIGNHDRPNGGGVHALEPLRRLRPGMIDVVDDFRPRVVGAGGAVIYPLPYPSRAAMALGADSIAGTGRAQQVDSEAIIAANAEMIHTLRAKGDTMPAVLLAHGTVEGCSWDSWQTVPLSDHPISRRDMSAFDAGVWGHIHKRQVFEDLGPTHGYVGALDRHTFGEAANPAGAMLYTFDADSRVTVEPRENPHAMRFETLSTDDLPEHDVQMRAEVDFDAGPRTAYRVTGEVSEDTYRAVGAQVRAWVAAGVIVTNACTVPRTDRARVDVVRTDLGVAGVLAAVFEARPDLATHAEHITGAVRAFADEVA